MAGGLNTLGNTLVKTNADGALLVALDGGSAAMSLATISQNAIGVTSTDGLILQNTTDAAAGAQQMSPRIRFHGEGWKTDATAASQTLDLIGELLPVQGAAEPSFNFVWKKSTNGGAYSTVFTFDSDGGLTLVGGLGTAQVIATGAIRAGAGNNIGFTGRAQFASPADSQLLFTNAAESAFSKFFIGTTAGPVQQWGTASPEGAVTAPVGSVFFRTDGGANTTLYIKESGAGNTGWVAK